jgi:GNAT superfamily N-acetyltransferase
MRIYDLDDLPESLYPQLGAFALSGAEPPQDIQFVRRLRKLPLAYSDYFAVYAVEGDRLLSRIETLHLPFVGRTGSQSVVGISDVVTRPEGLGRGLARTLLREVHRREIALGRRWSFLWTHRSWGAHALYESQGYEDVYTPPAALGPFRSRRKAPRPSGYRWTRETSRDGKQLERLLAQATIGRLGFQPRTPGSFRAKYRMGWRKPENHLVLWHGTSAVGFAHLPEDTPWCLGVNEVVVVTPEHAEPMLRALEATAGRRKLAMQGTSYVSDAAALLRENGYLLLDTSHRVLMAKPLVSRTALGEDVRSVFTEAGLAMHRGDMF